MIASLPPGTVLIAGSLLVLLLRGNWLRAALLLLPVVSAAHLLSFPTGATSRGFEFFEYQLTPIHVDRLSLVWGYIFHIAALVSVIYALHVRDKVQHISALVYSGAAIGAVFAGDLISLFVYWELTAISSVFLIWASRNERSYHAGMRYLIVQVGSGVLLLAGILLHLQDTGSITFVEAFPGLSSPGLVLIFVAFGIKAAFPLLHNWLTDAYPEATPTGTVFLSAFTTKLAIYALARGFPGTELLVWVGALMTAFPIFYAVIENDLRRVLAYSLNNQLGYMVVGVGIGTPLALNGTAAHAFAHILYKGLLFMSMGAVLLRTGTVKGSELGGLYKSMPWTTGFCIIGAASISAFPLFSGFVTKSLILTAAAEEHHLVVWLILLFASAGVFHHSGIKIPFFAFFAHDSGRRVPEAPRNMLLAMGITAALCILLGVAPGLLYAILPHQDVVVSHVTVKIWDYPIYTTTHVLTQLQLLLWSALAFTVLKRTGVYPPELPSVNLDTDWLLRRPFVRTAPGANSPVEAGCAAARRSRTWVDQALLATAQGFVAALRQLVSPQQTASQMSSISATVLWAAVLLTAYLTLYYFFI